MRAAVRAALSVASACDLRADDAVVLQDSNKLTLRLLPCDIVARVAHVGQEVAQFEVELAQRLAAMQYDSAFALRAMQGITQDAENISLGDERTAEQAAMALDSLYIAYSKQNSSSNAPEVRSAINALFQSRVFL